MKKKSLFVSIITFIAVVILLSFYIKAQDDWVINGNCVEVNNEKAFISACPHTLSKDGWITFNITSKVYTGNVDITLGLDTTQVTPKSAELYSPELKNRTYSYACNFANSYFNYTITPKHFWCYDNKSAGNGTGLELIYDRDFEWGNIPAKTAYWNISYLQEYKDISGVWQSLDYEHGGMNKWWYKQNIPIIANQSYQFRVYVELEKEFKAGKWSGYAPKAIDTKYWFAIKPSSETIQQSITNNHLYALDPWVNSTGGTNQYDFLTDGLVNYWNFNGSVLDDSRGAVIGNQRNMTGTNTANLPGVIENGLYFDGTAMTNTTESISALVGTGDFAVVLWFNKTTASGDCLWSLPDGSWNNRIYANAAGGFRVFLGGIDTGNIGGGVSSTGDSWNMFIIQRNAGYLNVYHNTTLIKNMSMTGALPNTHFALGNDEYPLPQTPYTGMMDEVGVWNRSLNNTEIADLYNNGLGISYLPESGGGDTTYPIFSDYWDNNGTLINSGVGYFNVTVENTNGTVIFHINNTNILATNLTINVYNVSYDFTSAGIYLYNWTAYGNGTLNNLGTSNVRSYTVNGSLACGTLNTANTIYNLTQNVFSTGICFNITAENITLNCNGYEINYSSAGTLGYGIYSNQNFTTIKNCIIKEGSYNTASKYAIYFNGATSGIIDNNTITTMGANACHGILLTSSLTNIISNNIITTLYDNGHGIELGSSSTSNNISNNTIITYGVNGVGIFLTASSISNNILNSIITTNATGGVGIYLDSNFNVVSSNIITTTGENGHGIYQDSSSLSTILNNSITTSGNNGYGISFISSSANTILNNSITTSGSNGYGIYLVTLSTNNSFSGMNIKTNSTAGYSIYIHNNNHNFAIRDSILNSSLASDFYIANGVKSGEWNFTNITRANGNPINISWITGANGTLNIMWYLDVNVSNLTNALQDANVSIWDKNNVLLFNDNTTIDGKIPRQTLLEYININNTLITYFSNYTINTTLDGYAENTQSANMSTNRQLVITLLELTDIEYPQFSNYWDNNGTLINSGIGYFNVTVINTNGTVILEINNTNLSATALGAMYNVSYIFTLNGTYPYRWHSWGNGTSANYNRSAERAYTVKGVVEITNCTILQSIENDLIGEYILKNNIDCSDTINWNGGTGFNSISYFRGTFDGNGYNITNLFINKSGVNNQGLFGIAENANVTNVSLINVSVHGKMNTGGLIGYVSGGILESSYTTGNVIGSGLNTGGLVGNLDSTNGIINNSYSLVNVNGTDQVGGLVGTSRGIIQNCYSAGWVNGTDNTRGLVGYVYGGYTCTNNFWDKLSSHQSQQDLCGTGKASGQMIAQSTFTNWDFTNVWDIQATYYPCLRNNCFLFAPLIPPPGVNITYPVNSAYYNYSVSSLNYTINDYSSLLSLCWYSIDNGITNSTITCGTNVTGLTSSEGSNTWTVGANDSLGNLNNSISTFIIDTIYPTISYGVGTLEDGVNVSQSNVYINTTWTETNFQNITFYLYNTTWSNTTTYSIATYSINFVSISNGYYWYNVSIIDKVNQRATTVERRILLDITAPTSQQGYTTPSGTYSPGVNGSFTNNATTNFTANITDTYGIKNVTITITNQSGDVINKTTITPPGGILSYLWGLPLALIDGVYHWIVEAYDIASNYIISSIMTLFVDTVPPSIISQNYTITWNNDSDILYKLNATYIEQYLMSQGIEFEGVNYTIYNISNNTYEYNFTKSLTYAPYTSSFYFWGLDNATNYAKSNNYYLNIQCPTGWKSFNNSRCVEDLTFTGNQNITRYLSIPNSISTLTSAYLNLSGLNYITSCYQETANISTNCGGLNTGVYAIDIGEGGYEAPISDAYDGNWETGTYCLYSNKFFYVNYSKPTGALNSSLWQYKGTDGYSNTLNFSFSSGNASNCWNAYSDKVVLRAFASNTEFVHSYIYCYNTTNWLTIAETGPSLYEEAMIWNNLNTYPLNTSLIIGNTNVWNYSGTFNQTNNKTNNLALTLNKYLNATYLIGSNYIIPFVFHSDTPGILRYLDITYSNEGFLENSQTFNPSTYETAIENFAINFTYDAIYYPGISVELIYDGVTYPATITQYGKEYIASANITVPLICEGET